MVAFVCNGGIRLSDTGRMPVVLERGRAASIFLTPDPWSPIADLKVRLVLGSIEACHSPWSETRETNLPAPLRRGEQAVRGEDNERQAIGSGSERRRANERQEDSLDGGGAGRDICVWDVCAAD